MKAIPLAAALLGLTAAAMPATVSAQRGWQPIAQRQGNLDARIDQGIRSGRLTRPEARRLTTEMRQLSRLESRYRAGGLNQWERRDLDRRYDALSARVRFDKHDRQDRRYR
ncbi:hypothetical protein Q5H91_10430 [Sphingomonas sp. KR1UV-12]|uniref:Uncharacterized protein n=1 Tax=Sphingomonas aurea TaxID=3063994 RepID=A0ABT9EKY8_9SPHN|nr:hypothetical protein [Sphingomonas sp. KR1UV-12]MDP1027630.1 hypothetical protein [Sphingomonas sp. KR1UV-12]